MKCEFEKQNLTKYLAVLAILGYQSSEVGKKLYDLSNERVNHQRNVVDCDLVSTFSNPAGLEKSDFENRVL